MTTTRTETTEPLTFELFASKRAVKVFGTDRIVDEARLEKLPDVPDWFPRGRRGSHPEIAALADKLNKVQESSGFVDWFFLPDLPIPEKV